MKREDIKKSFDNLKPSDRAKKRMLDSVVNNTNNKRFIDIKITIPVVLMLFVIVGGFIFHNLISNNKPREDLASDSGFITDEIAQVKNQFKIDNKTYIVLQDSQRKEFNFPSSIESKDIGDKITTISTTVDSDLSAKEVYNYLPAGCDAIVAVKFDNEYKLFKFLNFDSYMNNQDEDVKSYLELYGIYKGEDISKIQFLNYTEEAKLQGKLNIISEIKDKEKINEFYNYYSVIKNSSDNYFNKLFNYKASSNEPETSSEKTSMIPPDYPEGTDMYISPSSTNSNDTSTQIIDSNLPVSSDDSKGEIKNRQGSTPSSKGSIGDALANSVTIRIFNKNGVYYDALYYPNIGFISRHEVNGGFGEFLKVYIR